MILRRPWHSLDEVKGPTVAALLVALAASCSLNVGGLEAGAPGATGGGAAGGMSAATEATAGGTGGAGAGGAGATSSASSAGGGSTTFLWHSYDVTVDMTTGAMSVPGDARGTTPAATLTAYQADSPAGVTGKDDLNSYYTGGDINANENVGWCVTQGPGIKYPYVGRSALARDSKDGAPGPPEALDLQISLKDSVPKSAFIAFEVPIDGHYKLKDRAVHRILKEGDPTVLLVHLKQGTEFSPVDTPLEAGLDQQWEQDMSPHDFTRPLSKGDQIIFEINPKSYSHYDALEIAWTIEATVP